VHGLVVGYYRAEAEQRDELFLADALLQLLRLEPEELRVADLVRRDAVRIARSLPSETLFYFLHRCGRSLVVAPGFGELVLALPFGTGVLDNQSEFLLELLQALPGEEVIRLADQIVEKGATMARRAPLAALPLMELLDRHGLGDAAHRLAAAAVAAGGTDQARLPQRLRMSIYSKALEVETALEEGRFEAVESLGAEIRGLEAEIAEDDRLNSERRNRHVLS
jgi:hypothetical protein